MPICRTDGFFGQRKGSLDTNNQNAAREVRSTYLYPASTARTSNLPQTRCKETFPRTLRRSSASADSQRLLGQADRRSCSTAFDCYGSRSGNMALEDFHDLLFRHSSHKLVRHLSALED
jgi:hypothetical protein